MNYQLHHHTNRQSMKESLPQSRRSSHHRSQYSVDSADQGAGGYRHGSLRGSDSSRGSGARRAGEGRVSEQDELEYQQQTQQHIRHDSVVASENFAEYASQRISRRQPPQQRLSATRRSTLSSSYNSRGAEQLKQSLSEINKSPISQEMRSGSYNETAFSNRRQSRGQILHSQSLTSPRHQQNFHSQSLRVSIFTNVQSDKEEDDDEFDTIPLVSNEYLQELASRSTNTKMKNDDSMTNRLEPNNNNNGSDMSSSYRDSECSTLHQSVRIAVMRSNQNIEGSHNRRLSQGSINRHSFNSNQSSQTRQTGWDRGVRRQQRQQTNRRVSSSLNEHQLRQNSQRNSVSGMSSPLFHHHRRHTTGGGEKYDIVGVSLRHSTVNSGGYDNGIITSEHKKGLVLNRNPQESSFVHTRRSTGDMTNGSTDKELGCGDNVVAASLNSDASASKVKRKKVLLLGAVGVCLIVVIIIVVLVVYVTKSASMKTQAGNPSRPQISPENDVEVAFVCKGCISKPVIDIEGRCSPSNLPGSLSVCREACFEAACCYSNVEGEKCYDESNDATLLACGQYRPHCDVLYRPWPGASKGLIPDAPTSLFEGSDWDEICGSGASSLYGRKLSTNNSSQALTCLEFCLPSKCCFAPVVQSDVASQGLLLSEDGTYQSVATGEYIMTSCTPKNYKSCLNYADACRDLIRPLSFWQDGVVLELSSISLSPSTSTEWPTLQPTTQRPTTVRTTTTVRPTTAPTKESNASEPSGQVDVDESTSPPSKGASSIVALTPPPATLIPVPPAVVIPIADLTKIRNACTGIKNYNLIAKGEFNARMKCQNACSDGLCCFVDLGLGNEESCFSGNEDVCALYSDCIVLGAKPKDVLEVDSNSNGPPDPRDNLTSLCSLQNTATPFGLYNCFQACLPGSCCGATGETACFSKFEQSCLAYGPCQLMIDKYGGDSSQTLPPIPPNLEYTCSYSALRAFHLSDGNMITECNRICDAGMCCIEGTCGEGTTTTETAIADRCTLYDPCRNLVQLPTPPDDMETLCKDKESSQCLDACSVAFCCWASNDGGCFANFEQLCLTYVPYCAPKMSENEDFPATPSLPPPDLCMNGPPSVCSNACQAAPSCCFSPAVKDSCFAQNEETCVMWARCAFLFQEDAEITG